MKRVMFYRPGRASVRAVKVLVGSIATALVATSAHAQATLPSGVSDALASLSENAVAIATTILIAIIAVFAIKFIRKGL